jgi:MinD superfamily P-loop ATPase
MEIPFDRKIAESYSRGELLVDVRPEWREKFVGLYQLITDLIKRGKKAVGSPQ